MKQSRRSLRRLLLQSLEFRCVMDASGFEMGTFGVHDCDLETPAIISPSGESDDLTSTGEECGDENAVDPDMAKVMYFSMVGQDDQSAEDRVEDPIAMDSFIDMVKRSSFDETDGADSLDELIFPTFGSSSQDDGIMKANSSHRIAFDFDIDQNGSLSRLDVEMIVNYLSAYFRSENFAAFAQSNSSEMLQMDVDGDFQITPLDALIVINEFNRTEAFEGFAVSQSSRLADVSKLIVGDIVDENTSEVSADELSTVSSKMFDARMTDLAMTDFESLTEASNIAFFKSSSATKKDGTPFFNSVDDNGKVSAMADSQDLKVSIGEDHLISVDNESTGLSVVDLDGDFLLTQQADSDTLMFS